ncbi:MAG: UvrD-helicase domain-containing protein, partial [Burkholderiales bacterium]|nr:UvrD-helicase domain-containing protein [Burkholderiales bacterium]
MTEAAYQADDRPLPRDAFYALACDPQRSVVVEACAGAGKTWMLVSRVLRALLEGAQPHEILAITFTRKAAGEMRERLNQWLREFGAPHTPDAVRIEALVQRGVPAAQARQLAPELATLHERVLRSGRPVEIRTFHAWFSQLL